MRSILKVFASLSVLLALGISSSVADEIDYVSPDDKPVNGEVARLYSAEGKIEIKLSSGKKWNSIQDGAVFRKGDVIKVGRNSRAGVLFKDGMLLRLSENAIVKFDGDQEGEVVDIKEGKGHFFSRDSKDPPRIKTPMVNAAIFGTEFVVDASAGKSTIAMIDGSVKAFNAHGSVLAQAGEIVSADKKSAPTKAVLVKPFDSVQWAIQVPVVLETKIIEDYVSEGSNSDKAAWMSVRDGEQPDTKSASERSSLAKSYYLAKKDNLPEALGLVSKQSSAQSALLRAQLELRGGFISEAADSLNRALDKASDSKIKAAAKASSALLAMANNETDKARELLAEAEGLHAEGLNVGYVESLLVQLDGDIDYATSIMAEVAYRYPGESDVHARLAELYLAQGKRKKARAHIEKAKSLSFVSSYALMVEGFLELAERNSKAARAAFNRVIRKDSSLADAHMGLGLVAASEGDLKSSRAHFEKAVHLAPRRSVFRSYLGKAFFEDDSENLAQNEYDLAIQLDPEDPTPFLYRAFSLLSENKVVPALKDVEESIKRNDSRAVYRSRLLLDQDLGVRSASLARVFNDLGFSEVARLEAIKSINYDYLNYSAHRLLSDALVTIQDADSSFSSRRIADVLSPLSFNMFNSSGEQASSNEYNALFDKDEERTSLFLGGDSFGDLYSTELLHAGKQDDIGYVLSYDALYGFGKKNDDYLRNNRVKTALQYQPNVDHKFLFDGSYQYFELHDEEGAPIDSDTQAMSGSLAYVWKRSPKSTFVGEVKYNLDQDESSDFDSRVVSIETGSDAIDSAEALDEIFFDNEQDEEVQRTSGSAQYIYQADDITSIIGAQYLVIDTDRKEDVFVYGDEPAGIFNDLEFSYNTVARSDLNSYDTYLYNIFKPTPWFALDAGVAYSEVEYENAEVAPFALGSRSDDRFNPKFGLHLYPFPNLTLRAAYFESLRKSVLEDQVSIEPVIVGGFTQKFNDVSGSVSRTTALGADYKIPGQSYFGVEAMERHVVNPFSVVTQEFSFDFSGFDIMVDSSVEEFDNHVEQEFVKAWWYQVVCDKFVTTTDYYYYQNRFTDPDINQDITSHKTSVGLKYFLPGGLFAYSRSSWRQQDRVGSFFFDDGTEDFWVHDIGVGYRFPDRHGSVRFEVQNIFDEGFNYDQFQGFEEPVVDELSARILLQVSF